MQAKLCVDKNIPVTPIPGPSALVAAVSASGLSTDEFTFGNLFMILAHFEESEQLGGVIAKILHMFMQLDFFLNMLGQEKKGCPLLQMKQPPRYSSFLPTSFANFLKRLILFLVTLGKWFWRVHIYVIIQ